MNFLSALAKAGILWSLNNSTSSTLRGTPYPSQRLTLVMEDGTTFCKDFSLYTALNVHQLAAVVMAVSAARHPVLQAWSHAHGSEQVRLLEYAQENLGEVLHAALRKLADSKQSVITWNAIKHLHPSDWHELLTAARERVHQEFTAPKQPPTRRRVGLALKEVVLRTLDERQHVEATDTEGSAASRTRLQEFALRALSAGCSLTEDDEWIFGWTGFLCEAFPVPTDDASDESAESVAGQAA